MLSQFEQEKSKNKQNLPALLENFSSTMCEYNANFRKLEDARRKFPEEESFKLIQKASAFITNACAALEKLSDYQNSSDVKFVNETLSEAISLVSRLKSPPSEEELDPENFKYMQKDIDINMFCSKIQNYVELKFGLPLIDFVEEKSKYAPCGAGE